MLVLSRKVSERITIGPVTITIVKIKGNSVRVGVEAPKDVPILRAELNPEDNVTETETPKEKEAK